MADMSQMINSFLSDPNSMDKIKGIMGMLGIDPEGGPPNGPGSPDPPRAPGAAAPPETPANAGPPAAGNLPFDPDMMLRMKKAFDMMRQDDPRISLLLALKPNLSEPRRKRVDEAIHLMRLINLIPLLQDGKLF